MNKPHGTSAWRKYDDYIRHIKENTNLPWHIEELRIKSTVVDPLFSKTTFQAIRSKRENRTFVKFCFDSNLLFKEKRARSSPVTTTICANYEGEIITELSVKQMELKTHGLPTPVQIEPLRYMYELQG